MKYQLYSDPNNVFLDSSFNGVIRLTPNAALELCDIAINYKSYIDYYECGFWHSDKNAYEGREVWSQGKNAMQINDILENNSLAKKSIISDIEEGYNVFEIKVSFLKF
jgi:hypothetical protein